MISINSAVSETWIFSAIVFVALAISISRKKSSETFKPSLTKELKGLAILGVVFSHIGYFLVSDHRFLYPLSIFAGVSVNLFLLLSGYGITISSIKHKLSTIEFYKKRLPKLFIPFWIVLVVLFLADYLILGKGYSWSYILKSFLGIFNSAEIFQDINSPLWYFTLIFFYYLVYPVVFYRKNPIFSAIIIFFITYGVVDLWNPDFISKVWSLYSPHLFAFPLGMVLAYIYHERKRIFEFIGRSFSKVLGFDRPLKITGTLKRIFASKVFNNFIRYLAISTLVVGVMYLAVNSGVGKGSIEQYISIFTVLLVVMIFLLKRFEFRLLSILGIYSYEIYLLHWPIMDRYDIFYRYLPPSIATALYLVLFLILGFVLDKLVNTFILKIKKVD